MQNQNPSSEKMKKVKIGHRRPLVLLIGSLVCLFACKTEPSDALFNCFTPQMFKISGKMNQQSLHPGERANWYPHPYGPMMAYGQHPMR